MSTVLTFPIVRSLLGFLADIGFLATQPFSLQFPDTTDLGPVLVVSVEVAALFWRVKEINHVYKGNFQCQRTALLTVWAQVWHIFLILRNFVKNVYSVFFIHTFK